MTIVFKSTCGTKGDRFDQCPGPIDGSIGPCFSATRIRRKPTSAVLGKKARIHAVWNNRSGSFTGDEITGCGRLSKTCPIGMSASIAERRENPCRERPDFWKVPWEKNGTRNFFRKIVRLLCVDRLLKNTARVFFFFFWHPETNGFKVISCVRTRTYVFLAFTDADRIGSSFVRLSGIIHYVYLPSITTNTVSVMCARHVRR